MSDRNSSEDDDLELEDAEYRVAADTAYQELLDRIDEAQPQPRLEPTRKSPPSCWVTRSGRTRSSTSRARTGRPPRAG